MENFKLTWKERYVSILLLIIGIIYLALQILSMLTTESRSSDIEEDTIRLNKSEIYSDIRTFLTIFFCVAGAILLLKKKQAGWIMSLPVLIIFSIIVSSGWKNVVNMNLFDLSFILLAGATILLLLALIVLLLPYTREKYGIYKKQYIVTAILLAVLSFFYFWLQ